MLAPEGGRLYPLISHTFLEDLAMVLMVAAVTTVAFQAIRQPMVLGYLIAGMIVGPHLPIPLFADEARIHALAELGVILLMFALGLEFSLRRLVRMGPTAGFITAFQVGLMLWLGYVCGELMGFTRLESIFTGAVLSISSTTIVAKVYEGRQAPERLRELVFGVLLAEDLAAVVELAVLTALASGSGLSAEMVGITVGRLAIFLALLLGAGLLIVPRVMRLIARMESDETMLIASIGICFGLAIVAQSAGYSTALGAFLAGSLVAESGQAHRIEHLVRPVRDVFGAVFFVSVGMMLDPKLVADHWVALAVMVVAVLAGKIAGVGMGAVLAGSGPKLAIESGMSLVQIGEFSFIIAGVAIELHAAREFLYSLAIAVSVVTTLLTPFLIAAGTPLGEAVERHLPRALALFDSLYDAWIERIRSRAVSGLQRATIKRSLVVMVSSAILVAALVIYTEDFLLPIAMWISETGGLTFESGEALAGALGLLTCIAPVLGLYLGSRNLARAMAALAIARTDAGEPPEGGALVEVLQAAALLPFVLVTMAVVQPFLEPIDGAIVLAVASGVLGWVMWRAVRRTRGQLADAARILAQAFAKPGARPGLRAEPEPEMIEGIGILAPIRIASRSPAIGRTIDELDLRAQTGAAVIVIGRDGEKLIVVPQDQPLKENDVLGLAGPRHAIREAVRLLAPRAEAERAEDLADAQRA